MNPEKPNLFVKPKGNPFYCVDNKAFVSLAWKYSMHFATSPKARSLKKSPFGCTGPVYRMKHALDIHMSHEK